MNTNSRNPFTYPLIAIGVVLFICIVVFIVSVNSDTDSNRSENTYFSQIANDNYGDLFSEIGVTKVKSENVNDLIMHNFTFYGKDGQKVCSSVHIRQNDYLYDPVFPEDLNFDLSIDKNTHKISVYFPVDSTSISKSNATRSFYSFMESIATDCMTDYVNHLSWTKEPLNLDHLLNLRFGQLLDSMHVATVSSSPLMLSKKPDDGFRIFTAKDSQGNVVGSFNNAASTSIMGYSKVNGQWHVSLKDDKGHISTNSILQNLLSVSILVANNKYYATDKNFLIPRVPDEINM